MDYLHVLLIVYAGMNIRVHVSFLIRVSVFPGSIPRSGIAGSYGTVFLVF